MSKLLLSEQKEKNKKTKKVLTNIETNDICLLYTSDAADE